MATTIDPLASEVFELTVIAGAVDAGFRLVQYETADGSTHLGVA